MTIVPAADVELDLARVPVVIHDAGFRPSDLHVRARGRAEGAEHARFRPSGWTRSFLIDPALPDDTEHTLESDVDTSRVEPVFVRWSFAPSP